jgi:hypothetical protein
MKTPATLEEKIANSESGIEWLERQVYLYECQYDGGRHMLVHYRKRLKEELALLAQLRLELIERGAA